jgi:hypothetical protein
MWSSICPPLHRREKEGAPLEMRCPKTADQIHILSFPNMGGMDVSTHTLETSAYRLLAMDCSLGIATRREPTFDFERRFIILQTRDAGQQDKHLLAVILSESEAMFLVCIKALIAQNSEAAHSPA